MSGGGPADPSEAGAREMLVGHLARVLKRGEGSIDAEAEFPALGLDSAEMLFMVSALEEWSGLELPSDLPLDHPTVAALARELAGRLAARR